MSDAPDTPRPPRRDAGLAAFQVTIRSFAGGLALVLLGLGITLAANDTTVVRTTTADWATAVFVVLAGWGVGRALRRAGQPDRTDPAKAIAYWSFAVLAAVALLSVAAPRYHRLGAVELVLLSAFTIGLLVALSDRAGWDDRVARGFAALALAASLLVVTLQPGDTGTTNTVAVAGPSQLSAAARSGATVRLRGRDRTSTAPLPALAPVAEPNCTRTPLIEVRRTLLGFEEQRIETSFTACWDGDEPVSVVAQQFARSPWGAAAIEPVFVRTGSIFDADPLAISTQDDVPAPKYGDTEDDWTALEDLARPPALFEGKRVIDDADGANDTVVARVARDGTFVSVAAAYLVRYPTLLSEEYRERQPRGLEGAPQPRQVWLDRFQPASRDLVVVVAHLAKDGGSARMVRFTDEGQQPFSMTETTTTSAGG